MIEQLSAAVIAGILSGAGKSAGELIPDLYNAAKTTLSRIVPSFNAEDVTEIDRDKSESKLSKLLESCTPEQLTEIARTFEKLLTAIDSSPESKMLQRIVEIKGIRAKFDAVIDIETGQGSIDRIENVEGTNVRITSRQILS